MSAPELSSDAPIADEAPLSRAEIVAHFPAIASAAKWFWWIAGLSLINTVLIHSGSDTSFAVGLGLTLVADVVLAETMPAVAFVFDGLVLGFFVAMGFFALRGFRWAFVLGGVIYLLDALIFLWAQDIMSLGFHGLALYFIFNGFRQLNVALREAANV